MNLTEKEIAKIGRLLLNMADYWIEKIKSFDVRTQPWQQLFKKNLDPFLHYPCCILPSDHSFILPTKQEHVNFFVGLVDYHERGKHIIAGSRTSGFLFTYPVQIKLHDNDIWKEYLEKSVKIHELIYEKQREEAELQFLHALLFLHDVDHEIHEIQVRIETHSLTALPPGFPTKDLMIKLYKASCEAILKSPVCYTNAARYTIEAESKINCIGGDEYIQFYKEPNSKRSYHLRFGTIEKGEDFIGVFLGEDDDLKSYTDNFLKAYSTSLVEETEKIFRTMLSD
jgi:hypothetical protein